MIQLIYDNTFDGFLTAIFEAFYLRTNELSIMPDLLDRPCLFEKRIVITDQDKVTRVMVSIQTKMSPATFDNLKYAWLSHKPEIEDNIYHFLKLGFTQKRDICDMLQNDVVAQVMKAAGSVGREVHRFLGLVRFAQAGNIYVSDITPDYEILGLLAGHFVSRFASQPFIIRDRRYMQALIYNGDRWIIVPMDSFVELAELCDSGAFEEMWKRYYQSVNIKERKNPRCRMNHMPKKYWGNLTEMQ